MARVLIMRLSSFGDVAMLVPVVYSVAARYPQDRFYVMTRRAFTPLFDSLGFNVNVISIDLNKKHRGILGFFKVLYTCWAMRLSHVADEHDVLRTKILRWALILSGVKTRHINKGRREKQQMIETKILQPPLEHTIERYSDVLVRLGFPAKITFTNLLDFTTLRLPSNLEKIIEGKKDIWIGISPFAKHKGKVYPYDKMEQVIEMLSKIEGYHVFLFGAGKDEAKIIEQWTKSYTKVYNMVKLGNLRNELFFIRKLDVMLSMDSANMHVASLVETPVVSIWGATHPSLGFYGFRQDIDNVISIDLPCRPCSVYGEQPCHRPERDYACLNHITANMIVNKVKAVLSKQK